MINNFLKWRKEEEIDTILQTFEYPELEEALIHYPKGFFGTTKQGRPFWVENLGVVNNIKLLECTTEERMKKKHYCLYE